MCLFQPTFYLVICLSYSCQNKNFHVLQLLDKQLNLLLSGSLMGCHIRCQWSYSQWVGPAWMVELTIDGFVWFDIKHFMPHCLCWIVLWNDNWNWNQMLAQQFLKNDNTNSLGLRGLWKLTITTKACMILCKNQYPNFYQYFLKSYYSVS